LPRNPDVSLVDPAALYQIFQLVSQDEWKKMIALGKQTGKLDYKEINTVKALANLLKKKEAVDLRRLEITEKAAAKLKGFGINI
jgi:hypothetical protein